MFQFRTASTEDLGPDGVIQLVLLFLAAWPDGGFTGDDTNHAMGGRHFIAESDGRIVAHAAVVGRRLEADGRPLNTGYVEAVATLPTWQGRGLATRLMTDVSTWIRGRYELGALSAAEPRLYARLGWASWGGPLGIRTTTGIVRSNPDDERVMILRTPTTPTTPPLTMRETLTCDKRRGDSW
jgi:aminoglycoside 2'-N-acetyltransferase I